MVIPRTPAPQLTVPLVSGGKWSLQEQSPERFSLVVFYRGLHCPQCKLQLTELDGRLRELREVGVTSVAAISGDSQQNAQRTVADWELGELPVGYGVDEAQMRQWGLFLSHSVKDGEPELFNEPGMFLVQPDGMLYAALVQSMPFARPRLDDLLKGIAFVNENDYPARGEVA